MLVDGMPVTPALRRLLVLLALAGAGAGVSGCGPLNTLKQVGRHTEEAEGR
jgi:hypothetical protein